MSTPAVFTQHHQLKRGRYVSFRTTILSRTWWFFYTSIQQKYKTRGVRLLTGVWKWSNRWFRCCCGLTAQACPSHRNMSPPKIYSEYSPFRPSTSAVFRQNGESPGVRSGNRFVFVFSWLPSRSQTRASFIFDIASSTVTHEGRRRHPIRKGFRMRHSRSQSDVFRGGLLLVYI